MIIEKIDIKSFGALTDMTLDFNEGINVIEGQNEAGKSTIAAFIRYMLFGFDPDDKAALSERKKRINWTTGTAQGSMIVRVKGKRYLITRTTVPVLDSLGRETYKEDSSIIDMDSGTTSFGKLAAGEVFFGVSGELFVNTAFVGQVGDSAINEGSVTASIENILFSGSERINTERAIAKLGEKMDGLMHRDGQSGVIPDLMRRRDELVETLSRSNEDNKQILAKETELFRIRQERSESEQRLDRLVDLENCYTNVMKIQSFDELHVLEEDSAAKADAYSSFIRENTRAGYVPTEEYLTDIALSRRAVNDTYRTLVEAEDTYAREKSVAGITHEIENMIELTDTMGGERGVLDAAGSARGGFIKNIIFTVLTALAAIAAVVYEIVAAGIFAETLLRVAVGAVGAVALVGVILFAVFMAREKKRLDAVAAKFGVETYEDLVGKIAIIGEARVKRDGLVRAIENARVHLERSREAYDNAKAELTRVIVRWGEEPPTSGLEEFLDRLTAKVSAFLERKKILLDEKNVIELSVRELRRQLADISEIDIRATVSPMKRKVLSTINHDDIVSGISQLRLRIDECKREEQDVESELISLRVKAGDPSALCAKIAALDERIAELSDRHKAYYTALKCIENASNDLRSEISPRLGEYATELMSVMTDKKYNSFSVSDGMRVTFTADDGTEKSVDFLSGGTRDLAYIAVRMALIDMLYAEKPPVCFDETFAHQDNVRARSMMRAVARLADDGYQSFVFTCRAREGALATEITAKSGVYKLSSQIDDAV